MRLRKGCLEGRLGKDWAAEVVAKRRVWMGRMVEVESRRRGELGEGMGNEYDS